MSLAPNGQPARLLQYLRANPGATPMAIVTELRMPKYTARASDLRAAGYDVRVTRDDLGVTHYSVHEAPVQSTLFDEVDVAHYFAGPRR